MTRGEKALALLGESEGSGVSGWQPIATAPRDGTAFIALNSDREVWVAQYEQRHGRLCFRHHGYWEPSRHTKTTLASGKDAWVRDDDYADPNAGWHDYWCIWTRGHEFAPTHWIPLPAIPTAQGAAA